MAWNESQGLWGTGCTTVSILSEEDRQAALKDAAWKEIKASESDALISWQTLNLATGQDVYQYAIEQGLISPCSMPKGLKLWIARANGIIEG